VLKTLNSGTWCSGAPGPKVREFEKEFAKYIGCYDSVAVNSGSAALDLALSIYDIKGMVVILPSLTFASTAHAVLRNGGILKFADIEEETLCMDPNTVEIKDNTACVIPVHFGGIPASLDYDIPILQDCAHACGTIQEGKKIGDYPSLSCFSFNATKNLPTPCGGAITIHNYLPEITSILKAKRWSGISNRKGSKYDITETGGNYYMNEISATIGLSNLKELDARNHWRRRIAKEYCERLEVPHMPWHEGSAYHLFWIRVKNRDYFRDKMYDAGIETGIHYNPLHKMSLFASGKRLPVTEKVAREIVSIPIHTKMSFSDVDKIINTISSLN
jgi:perosamine synthetase